jgi:hypothetical protein
MASVTSDSSIEELVLILGGEFLMGSDSWVDFAVGFRCVKDLESHDDSDTAGL